MRKQRLVHATAILLVALLSGSFGAVDKMDSLTVRSILDQIGWTNVRVDSVINKELNVTSSTRVTNLKLVARDGLPKITGLPAAVGKLPELLTLSLEGNALSDLPQEISSLFKLSQVNIAYNAFTSLPAILGDIPSLKVLDASHNKIDSLPSFIGQLTNLVTLYLDANLIAQVPSQIKSLVNIKNFTLASNQLSKLPAEIGALTALELLSLDSNMLSSLPTQIISLERVKIGVRNNRLCTLTDESLIAWLNAHQLAPEWRAAQNCIDTGYSAIVTDVTTGTVIVFTSTFVPASDIQNAISLESMAKSNITSVPSGKEVLKVVNISINPIFKNKVNSFLITIPFSEQAYSTLDIAQLAVYSYDGQNWTYFGGTVNEAKKTISIRTGKEGIYALVYDRSRSQVRNTLPAVRSVLSLSRSSSALMVRFGHPVLHGASVSFLTLSGKVISRVAVIQEGARDIAVKIPVTLSGKPCIVIINDGRERLSRLLPLP